jgi:hypothetical protein
MKQKNKTKRQKGGNPCGSNKNGIQKQPACNGQDDILGDEIQNGYCLDKQCIDKRSIQLARLHNRIENKMSGKPSIFKDPYTKREWSDDELIEAGIEDPLDSDYQDEEYIKLVQKYNSTGTRSNFLAELVRPRSLSPVSRVAARAEAESTDRSRLRERAREEARARSANSFPPFPPLPPLPPDATEGLLARTHARRDAMADAREDAKRFVGKGRRTKRVKR